jgi:hypothetical protein
MRDQERRPERPKSDYKAPGSRICSDASIPNGECGLVREDAFQCPLDERALALGIGALNQGPSFQTSHPWWPSSGNRQHQTPCVCSRSWQVCGPALRSRCSANRRTRHRLPTSCWPSSETPLLLSQRRTGTSPFLCLRALKGTGRVPGRISSHAFQPCGAPRCYRTGGQFPAGLDPRSPRGSVPAVTWVVVSCSWSFAALLLRYQRRFRGQLSIKSVGECRRRPRGEQGCFASP